MSSFIPFLQITSQGIPAKYMGVRWRQARDIPTVTVRSSRSYACFSFRVPKVSGSGGTMLLAL